MVIPLSFEYRSASELLWVCASHSISIADAVFANETSIRAADEVRAGIDSIADTMLACIDRGLRATEQLPGSLKVQRRANSPLARLKGRRSNVPAPTRRWNTSTFTPLRSTRRTRQAGAL